MIRTIPIFGIISMLFLFGISYSIADTRIFESRTIFVDDDGGQEFTSIQDAIDHAGDGDTVFVYSGVYRQALMIDKKIDVIGEHKHSTIIDLEGIRDEGVTILSNNVRFMGFSIINANYHENPYPEHGIGIKIIGFDRSVIANNIITNCNTGIYMKNCKYTVVSDNTINNASYLGIYLSEESNDNVIDNNTLFDYKEGIRLSSGCRRNQINGNKLLDAKRNYHFDCAAIVLSYSFRTVIENNYICSKTNRGIYLYHFSYENEISYNIINDCLIGIELEYSCENIIKHNEIMNCNDSGLHLEIRGSNRITNNNFIHNTEHATFTFVLIDGFHFQGFTIIPLWFHNYFDDLTKQIMKMDGTLFLIRYYDPMWGTASNQFPISWSMYDFNPAINPNNIDCNQCGEKHKVNGVR